MAERRDRHNMRNSRLWIFVAIAVAILAGLAYYVFSAATQPSVVSDDGAELMTPREVEDEALGEPGFRPPQGQAGPAAPPAPAQAPAGGNP